MDDRKWKMESGNWKLETSLLLLSGILAFDFPVSNFEFPSSPLALVRRLEPGDGSAQSFAGPLHVNFRVGEAFQPVLSSLLGFLGTPDVNLFGALGTLHQNDDAVGKHLSEPPVDAQEVLNAFPSVSKFAGHEFGQQGSVAGQHSDIPAFARHSHRAYGVAYQQVVWTHDVQLQFSWEKITHGIESLNH